jgi:hypothetical protein
MAERVDEGQWGFSRAVEDFEAAAVCSGKRPGALDRFLNGRRRRLIPAHVQSIHCNLPEKHEMPLDAPRANTKTLAITNALALIGDTPPTQMPRSGNKNTEAVAWEVFVAKLLEKTAKARTTKAVKAAIAAGVMFDHEEDPCPVGTNKVVYDGDIVRIDLEVGTPGMHLEVKTLMPALVKASKGALTLEKVSTIFTQHMVENAAPHKFTPSLVTDR